MTPPNVEEKGTSPDQSPPRGDRGLRVVDNAGAEPSLHSTAQAPVNLPPYLSSFVGREQEIAEVKRLISGTRLLTLTGPGGCGKTRLAVAVASEVAEGFEDGAWWASLAPLSDPHLVPQAVASALGVRESPGRTPTEALVEHLKNKGPLLLVIDNCEHLVDACAWLADELLRSSTDLKILATSREALGVGGEVSWLVPSLSMPDDPGRLPPVGGLGHYEAIRLFLERAKAVAATFELTERNAATVAQLCLRLEGIPLAIELAAARTKVLSIEQILERLEDSLRLLSGKDRTAPARQRTLRATLDWSYELLEEREQGLFGRLSVFAGGWTLEAAEAVGTGEGIGEEDVLDLLSGLVDKSLVVTEAGAEGAARYRMLEPVRQYGAEKLEGSGEEQEIRRRHAAFFLRLAEEAEPELKGSRQVLWVQRLSTEHGNLRVAVRSLLERQEWEKVARFGWALWLFWWWRVHLTEGRRWMEEALEKGSAMPVSARAKVSFVAGTMAVGQADYPAAGALLDEGYRLFWKLGDKRGAAYALGTSGFVSVGEGQPERALARHEEAVRLFLEVEDKWAAVTELFFSAVGWFKRGDHGRAKRLAEQGLALAREAGDNGATSMVLYILAMVAHASGEYERATESLEEALSLAVELGDETHIVYFLQGLAAVAASERKVERAARLWGAAEALLEEIEITAYPHAPEPSVYEEQVSAARSRLNDEEAFAAAWAEGRAITLAEAVEYALKASPTSTHPPPTTAGLSERELEIVRLVAEGLTDAQVASRLYLSPRTVGQHLRSIYRKLGVPSRAAASRAAAERGMI